MNLRHATALALMGWYLMVPPFVHYDPRELWAPVSQWKIVERFDTATACKGYLQEMKEDPGALHGEYKVASKFQTEGLNRMRHMRIDSFALRYAGCIFSDDPRLDEK
jgi:hypothetical protein